MRRAAILSVGCILASVSAGCVCGVGQEARVSHLVAARATGEPMELLTRRFGRISIEQAYEVQDGLTEAIVGSGDPVAGYKIGFAGKGAQEAWGLDEPAYGRLHKSMAVADGGSVSLGDYNAFHMEVEVAFVMARRVDRPIKDAAELRPYVRSVHPAFDLPSNRFRSDGGPRKIADVIADDVAANRFVLGPAADPGKLELGKLTLSGTHDGRQVYTGPASSVMGDPWEALRWLANALLRRGGGLEAGDVVLSGAAAKMYSPKPDQAAGRYVGDCGPLGRVTCEVLAATK